VKCLIQTYINFTSEFDRDHGPLSGSVHLCKNKKFELMLMRRAKAYSSSGSVV